MTRGDKPEAVSIRGCRLSFFDLPRGSATHVTVLRD
jgi:hypothetical protein